MFDGCLVCCFTVILIHVRGVCRFSSSSILLVWMEPLAPVGMVSSGLTFHPWALIASIRGLYFFLSLLVLIAWSM